MPNPPQSSSIKAVKLARAVFESIQGNLGLLRFNIEKLTPKNGIIGDDSRKWEIVCSFYESLGSSTPVKYEAFVDLDSYTVSIKKIDGSSDQKTEKYKVQKEE